MKLLERLPVAILGMDPFTRFPYRRMLPWKRPDKVDCLPVKQECYKAEGNAYDPSLDEKSSQISSHDDIHHMVDKQKELAPRVKRSDPPG